MFRGLSSHGWLLYAWLRAWLRGVPAGSLTMCSDPKRVFMSLDCANPDRRTSGIGRKPKLTLTLPEKIKLITTHCGMPCAIWRLLIDPAIRGELLGFIGFRVGV